jgi:hypothetical protein
VNADDFRRIALGLAGASEGAHMNHPDFRVNGRIFASLHSDGRHGMVKLSPDEQQRLLRVNHAFAPESGAWGRQGCTRVSLAAVDEETLGEALTLAWRQTSAMPPTRRRSARPAYGTGMRSTRSAARAGRVRRS